MRLRHRILLAAVGYAFAWYACASPTAGLDWDTTFADHSFGRPLHFVAHYQDRRGAHRLEEWRQGTEHLRRRTDDRIDLHADRIGAVHAGQPADYLWQIVDIEKKVDHRISTHAMLQTGMIYSFWSMAHVLVRPAGRSALVALPEQAPVRVGGVGCEWYVLQPDSQPATRVCWASSIAAPLRMQALSGDGQWNTTFSIDALDSKPLDAAQFRVNTAALQVRNVDELAAED